MNSSNNKTTSQRDKELNELYHSVDYELTRITPNLKDIVRIAYNHGWQDCMDTQMEIEKQQQQINNNNNNNKSIKNKINKNK
jgi:hypothetical protein